MRRLMLALVLAAILAGPAAAGAPPYRAGLARLDFDHDGPMQAFVWYPTEAAEAALHFGPFALAVARDAPVALGRRFPVVLLSHGGGGTPLLLRDMAAGLARDGFMVVAPFHVGDSTARAQGRAESQRRTRPLSERPKQARLALDAALADARFASQADPRRLGMIGFSLGGYTTLLLAGARPDLARWASFCRERADPADRARVCVGMDGGAAAALSAPDEAVPAFKALVLLDPFALPFGPDGLAALTMPLLLYRPEREDVLPARFNALALAASLPRPPLQATLPGGHFALIGSCPAALAAEAPAVCTDDPPIDRTALQRRLRQEIADFLRRSL